MTTDEGLKLSLQDVIRSNIQASYMADYGVVKAVHGNPVTSVDVVHYAPAWVEGENIQPNITNNVEVLYTATAGVSIEIPIAVGDSVLLVGSRKYVDSIANVTTANCPKQPGVSTGYDKATLKAIPVGDLMASSAMYLRFKAGKMQLKNATKSLYTVLDTFEAAIQTFSNATSQASLTAGATTSATLATALNLLLAAMNASVTTAKADLALILEA